MTAARVLAEEMPPLMADNRRADQLGSRRLSSRPPSLPGPAYTPCQAGMAWHGPSRSLQRSTATLMPDGVGRWEARVSHHGSENLIQLIHDVSARHPHSVNRAAEARRGTGYEPSIVSNALRV